MRRLAIVLISLSMGACSLAYGEVTCGPTCETGKLCPVPRRQAPTPQGSTVPSTYAPQSQADQALKAIGQSLTYAYDTCKAPAIILLVDDPEKCSETISWMRKRCELSGIKLYVERTIDAKKELRDWRRPMWALRSRD